MAAGITISELTSADWPRVEAIYEAGIATGNATFETRSPGWEAWNRDHLDGARLVARLNGVVVGWVALSAVSERCVYGGVAEVSLYVDPDAAGRGVGSALMEAAVASAEASGLWTLQAGIFPENEASIALHAKHGFRTVGVRERLGQLGGRWRDVVLMERRSDITGV